MTEQSHKDRHPNRSGIMILLTLPLIVLAFTSKFWYTLYFALCFVLAFLSMELADLGIRVSGLREGLRRTWYLFIISLVATAPLVWFLINQNLPEFWLHVAGRVESSDLVQTLIVGVIAAPFFEEVIFRGLVLEQLSNLTNGPVALLLSSAMFAAVHWSPGLQLLVAVDLILVFCDGVWFGLIYMKSRNTILSTLCHSLGNLIFILYATFIIGITL